MSKDYPHLSDTAFPNASNVNVYKYANDFDYSKFDNTQMTVHVGAVPWDQGEVHLGNRVLNGLGNVVYFDSTTERDTWFKNSTTANAYTFETKYRDIPNTSLELDIPLPFDQVTKYNYIWIEYNVVPNATYPVDYENANGMRKWFFFIRTFNALAPNTTRVELKRDTWTTFINRITIPYMFVERGHYAIANTDVDTYLSNPLANNNLLLAEDINYGQPAINAYESDAVLNNGTIYACFATNADVANGTWGTKAASSWITPADSYINTQSVTAPFIFAINVSDLPTFLTNVDTSVPQFKQSVLALFFVGSNLLTIGLPFTFASISCYSVSATQQSIELLGEFNKEMWDYEEEYAGLAKLYTYPYSYFNIHNYQTDNDLMIKIEDTVGKLDVKATLNLVFPYIGIDAFISGIGGSEQTSITFKNIDSRSTVYSGRWFDTIEKWNIPTFEVIQSAEKNVDYATFYDRAQATTAYTNTQTNEYALADTDIANTALQVTANSAITATENSTATTNTGYTNAHAGNNVSVDNTYTSNMANAEIVANKAIAGISMAASVVSGGLTGGKIGAVGGALNALVTAGQTAASINLTQSQTTYAITQNSNKLTYEQATPYEIGTIELNTYSNTATNSARTANTNATNTNITGQTANDAATQKANAVRDSNTAQAAIDNSVKSASINAPSSFGTFANGQNATTRPQGYACNIITQNKGAIRQTGDMFLRYGYALNQNVNFETFNVMPHFSFWKVSDMWIDGLDVEDKALDEIRFYLYGGVTVWRNPDDIGKIGIYDNK